MTIFLQKIIFKNRAPFQNLDLDFKDKEISVLTAVNGKGKTTILSHIVDAFYEMARPHFHNEFEDKTDKYYRVSSTVSNLLRNQPSFVYMRFIINENETVDYIDIRNMCTAEQYNEAITLDNKIPYSTFEQSLKNNNNAKEFSSNLNREKSISLFKNNIITYFPSYRFEPPGYLNDPYKVKLKFRNETPFSGFLPNPIEAASCLSTLVNWMMDLCLDAERYPEQREILSRVNTVINQMLTNKGVGEVSLGVGPRNLGSTRMRIIGSDSSTIYPTLFNLSSGEAALLCIFAELVRQSDVCTNGVNLNSISGIVIIDEIEKHLHIKMQKEILPKLFNLFPNIQFIISSHSPFLNMGLADEAMSRSRIVDIDNLGISNDPTTNPLYLEVYELMIHENNRFKEVYDNLQRELHERNTPLILTEGKTDISYLKRAKEKLVIEGDFDFFEVPADFGDSKLKNLLEQLSKVPHQRKIIGIFDRDVTAVTREFEGEQNGIKNYSNNVFGFCIPIPDGLDQYQCISMEFYFKFRDLTKEINGKRIYFSNEVHLSVSTSRPNLKKLERLSQPIVEDELVKKIYDSNIGDLNWIHSKARFAELVETNNEFINGFDFENFRLIFNKIQEIINI